MSNTFNDLNPAELGNRMRLARESVKLNQSHAAAAVGLSRTTLVAIEQGQRRIRIDELQKFAQLYGTTVNALVRNESVHVDLVPRFRMLAERTQDSVEFAGKLLSDLVKAEVELENVLGIKRAFNYPPERPLLRGDVIFQAEQDAAELRHRLGLGISPITNLLTLLEFELGIRVYVRRLEGKISGLFAFDASVGACMLLNANHTFERREQTAGHETGHFMTTRSLAEVLIESEQENSREERYANAFARSLLAPSRAVMQKFQEVTAGSDRLTRRHIILLSHFFGISREATVRRLEEIGLAKQGTWDWFESNGGITDDHAKQVLGEYYQPGARGIAAERPTSLRLDSLAAEAYRRELLSEGQLAKLLRMDRIRLREILDDHQDEGSEMHVNLPRS